MSPLGSPSSLPTTPIKPQFEFQIWSYSRPIASGYPVFFIIFCLCFLFLPRICLQYGRPRFDLWVGKIPWRRERLPTPVFWPGNSKDCIAHGVTKSRTQQSHLHFNFFSSPGLGALGAPMILTSFSYRSTMSSNEDNDNGEIGNQQGDELSFSQRGDEMLEPYLLLPF